MKQCSGCRIKNYLQLSQGWNGVKVVRETEDVFKNVCGWDPQDQRLSHAAASLIKWQNRGNRDWKMVSRVCLLSPVATVVIWGWKYRFLCLPQNQCAVTSSRQGLGPRNEHFWPCRMSNAVIFYLNVFSSVNTGLGVRQARGWRWRKAAAEKGKLNTGMI